MLDEFDLFRVFLAICLIILIPVSNHFRKISKTKVLELYKDDGRKHYYGNEAGEIYSRYVINLLKAEKSALFWEYFFYLNIILAVASLIYIVLIITSNFT